MHDRHTLKRHAALVDRMASALGIDLEEAALAGRLAFDEIADAVLRCAGCVGAVRCAEISGTPASGVAAPVYCANRRMFSRLVAARTPRREGELS
ncbi:MAG: DUF6455 family protein [Antarcticimicrobium sp.]|uniref:DUF6455 family protein n=1 Tax=Antarcticimicrobium sp. TaxID=2824147 RepID=UPI0026255253|nr:DUF6455 family protein [Antarcticimicrobium sp.]MDF1716691.1 DUF6455 family protein [Antarcticimicrobium sp.]